jgi:hypothetical protein
MLGCLRCGTFDVEWWDSVPVDLSAVSYTISFLNSEQNDVVPDTDYTCSLADHPRPQLHRHSSGLCQEAHPTLTLLHPMPTSDNSVLHDALAIVSTLPDHPSIRGHAWDDRRPLTCGKNSTYG